MSQNHAAILALQWGRALGGAEGSSFLTARSWLGKLQWGRALGGAEGLHVATCCGCNVCHADNARWCAGADGSAVQHGRDG